MKNERRKIKRRYAYILGHDSLVIDVTPQEYARIKDGRLAIEKVKQTPEYAVYRIKNDTSR